MTQKPRVRMTTDGRVRMQDGFMNMAANLGVNGRDKATGASFVYVPLAHYALINAYRQSWLAQKIIDIVPEDATRAWRGWQAETSDVSKIEETEKLHNVKTKVKDALRLARLVGGSALYYSIKGQDPAQPLVMDRVRRGDLVNVVLLSRYNLTCAEVETNLEDPRFGEPKYFQLAGVGTSSQRIHPSRLAIFRGPNVPGTVGSWEWGDPVLQSVLETVKQTEAFPANIVSLLYEANVDILTIPGLMDMMRQPADPSIPGDLPGDIKVAMYLKTVAQIKGNNGMLVLDGGDAVGEVPGQTGKTEFTRKAISFAGLSDLWDRSMKVAAAAADIPMTRMWAESPAGLNSTGESDSINYYQNVNSVQENEITANCRNFEEVVIRSSLGDRPDDIHYLWNPLYEESADKKTERGVKTVAMVKDLNESGIYPTATLQRVATNALIETGALPGMEAALETLEADQKEEDDLEAAMMAALPKAEPEAAADNVVPMKVKDAAPRTLYVSRKVLNGRAILAHYEAQGFTGLQPPGELHVTMAYSTKPLDWMKLPEPYLGEMTLSAGGPRVQEQFGKFAVLSIKARELEWRHDDIIRAGATWDHDQYQPHISLAKGADLTGAKPWQGEIKLGPEIWEEIKE